MEETMNTKNRLAVDQLPVRTWNRLNVNEAVIEWDEARTADLGTETYTAESDGPGAHRRLRRGRVQPQTGEGGGRARNPHHRL